MQTFDDLFKQYRSQILHPHLPLDGRAEDSMSHNYVHGMDIKKFRRRTVVPLERFASTAGTLERLDGVTGT